jgi:hypothetical protein
VLPFNVSLHGGEVTTRHQMCWISFEFYWDERA